ncbi:uncharacterized protein LOC62_05G007659 [Vanrija pseudolonga]|uniref:Uncharacterized protein n=1 Tax=Vanrija pseudolonga TaxID=143232 RepID=A0AAF0YCC1_9TREE|nr:hypothetical protein LOC62_05G007659 [Vanrija pseudolonga]
MAATPLSSSALYPWEPVGRWSVILTVPKEVANNETMAMGVYNINNTDSSKLYTGLRPNAGRPATNKTWPADWYWFNISESADDLVFWRNNPVEPGPGYYVALKSDPLSGVNQTSMSTPANTYWNYC